MGAERWIQSRRCKVLSTISWSLTRQVVGYCARLLSWWLLTVGGPSVGNSTESWAVWENTDKKTCSWNFTTELPNFLPCSELQHTDTDLLGPPGGRAQLLLQEQPLWFTLFGALQAWSFPRRATKRKDVQKAQCIHKKTFHLLGQLPGPFYSKFYVAFSKLRLLPQFKTIFKVYWMPQFKGLKREKFPTHDALPVKVH